MREIKFRVLNIDGDYLYLDWDDLVEAQFDQESLKGQYTGLKDKNGKEIYEGDIVKFGPEGNYMKYSIVFNNSAFIISAYSCIHESNLLYVIGNIYESPELLEPEDNEE